MDHFDNFFVIGGTGRNVGKTTFIEMLLKEFSSFNRISAIKITNHFHEFTEGQSLLCQNDHFIILEERQFNTDKDTSRFLQAGADNSILIMAKEDSLEFALKKANQIFDFQKGLFIVESAALLQYISPGLSGLITDISEIKSMNGYDFTAQMYSDRTFSIDVQDFKIIGNNWRFA